MDAQNQSGGHAARGFLLALVLGLLASSAARADLPASTASGSVTSKPVLLLETHRSGEDPTLLRYNRTRSATGTILSLERSEDLLTWLTVAESVLGQATTSRFGSMMLPTERPGEKAGYTTVEVPVDTFSLHPAGFFRLIEQDALQIDAARLPLLPPGVHHGFQVAFEALPAGTALVASDLQETASEAGMMVARAGADWAEIEIAPGVYDREALLEGVEDNALAGHYSFVWIPLVDSAGLTLPAHLSDESGGFRDDLGFNSPEVVDAYCAVLDWAAPALVRRGAFVLSVGNEPDAYLEAHPGSAAELADFLAAVRQHARTLDPRLAVTITLTGSSLLEGRDFAPSLLAHCDVASVNYYPLNPDLSFRGPLEQTVPADMDTIFAATAPKGVIFQELGCPTGWTDRPSAIGVTEADAAEFFRLAFAELNSRPRARASFVFQLVDWSPALTEMIYGPARDSGELDPVTAARLFEWLETTGMITFDDGTIKAPWQVFLGAVAAAGR